MQTTIEQTTKKPTTMTVTCEFGTFTRKTARTYEYVVIVVDAEGAGVLSWAGRFDLAEKVVADRKRRYHISWGPEKIAIVRVQDGATVRDIRMGAEII